MNIMGMGIIEIGVVLLVAFLVLGPGRSIDMARSAGKMLGDLRRSFNDVTSAVSMEVTVRVEDIDSGRMVIRICQGKGKKDRYGRLSPGLLKLLREYWRACRPESLLFPGAHPKKRYDLATPGQILKKLCRKARITKRVSMHTLQRPSTSSITTIRSRCR